MSDSPSEEEAEEIERLIEAGLAQQALEKLEQTQSLREMDQRTLLQKGRALGQLERWTEAVVFLKQATQVQGPLTANAHYWLGNTYRDLDDVASACSSYQLALESNPKLTEAWINMGSMLDDVGQHQWALRCYSCALRIDSCDPIAWCNRGNSERELELFAEAADSYRMAIELRPDCFEAQLGLAVCQVNLNERQGLSRLEEIFQSSRAPLALFELASAHSMLGNYANALSSFDQLISHGVEEPALWNNRGQCLVGLGRLDEALQSFDRAIEADVFFEAAYIGKAQVLVSLGRPQEARIVLEQLRDFCSDQLRDSPTLRHLLSLI